MDGESSYQSHLTTLSLPDLLAEPGTLQTQAHHLTSSLTSLTHTSYPTFLTLHQTTTALSTSLSTLSDTLSDLLSTSLPALQGATTAWSTRTTDVLRERSKARLVLDQHDKIKDLLDIPIFIDSCVRNGYFQEALSLASHVSAMAASPTAPPILASVHAEVKAAIAQMLVVLLGTLNEPGRKLPALWKAVNFLRKMDAFGSGRDKADLGVPGCLSPEGGELASSEELLALAFLSGRLTCLTAALEPISRDIYRLINSTSSSGSMDYPRQPNGSAQNERTLSDRDQEDISRYLKKYIDIWREGAYDILTQYSTIFLERQQHPNPTSPKPSPRSPTHKRRTSVQIQHQPIPPPPPAPSLLPFLSPHLLSHLLPILKTALPALPLPLLPSLLTQLTYCATAFTRVGLDFRGLIGGMIGIAVTEAVRRGLHDVEPILGRGKTRVQPNKRPSEWLVTASALNTPPRPTPITQAQPPHIPPQLLAAYPPFAKYTNALLGVLNALRLLAPVAIMYELADMLDGALGRAGEELIGALRMFIVEESKENEGENGAEDRIARAAGEAYFVVLVPFMRRALAEGVYGTETLKLGDGGGEGEGTLREAVGAWEEVSHGA